MITTAFFSVLLLFACKSKQTSADNGSVGAAGNEQAQLGGKAAADSLFLNFQRTPCFGTCKAYRINLYRSGHATFEGVAHMEKEGMHRAVVGRDTMEMILAEARSMGFFDLKDEYDSQVTDLPSTIIRIHADGVDKQVIGRVGTPESFKALANKLDELLLPVPWVPMPVDR